ncbi:MAG TPA: hypothetical protein VLH79_12530 [Chthonomonadales bacterium]|nr:hypothetical protein [Chthonomonadales bacterium]
MRLLSILTACGAACAAFLASAAPAPKAEPLAALGRMPVREVTVFKDGHAFVLHAGKLPTDAQGDVQMDHLPMPVLGTFWPYCAEPRARLSAVTASVRRVRAPRTALSIPELIEANPGAQVVVTELTGKPYAATIIGVPTRSSEEAEKTNPPNADPVLPVKGQIVMLRTQGGTAVVPISRIRSIEFRGTPKSKLASEEFRNLLTLRLDWQGARRQQASVGMMYLQRGLRWIPGYRVTLDGKGTARVTLQATLINELADLTDVSAHLVVGVPSFDFRDTLDPMALQQTMAQLSAHFQSDARTPFGFSNAIMSQSARFGERMAGLGGAMGGPAAPAPPQPRDLGPEVVGADRAEDLFVFTVKRVTLGKGQRMVIPVAEYTLKYRSVYALNMAFAPPPEVRANVNNEQQAALARLFLAPSVEHRVRITNDSPHPFTTAPALLLQGERVLGQAMMTYTSRKGEVDLRVTTATDLRVQRDEVEKGRTPNARQWSGYNLTRVDMSGKATITNFGEKAAEIEVTRHVLGHVDSAGMDGVAQMVNPMEEAGARPGAAYPHWWSWYSWPGWWHNVNGLGRFRWKVTVEPGKTVDLPYAWHYFWG